MGFFGDLDGICDITTDFVVLAGGQTSEAAVELETWTEPWRALAGKVDCLPDVDQEPIRMGDFLTTSTTPGRAVRASGPAKAFGGVLGKRLGALSAGRGLVPVLISLQTVGEE